MLHEKQSLAEKYRPQNYESIVGQTDAIKTIEDFLRNFPKKKALLLYGPPGTGKTSLVLAAAKVHDLEIKELNSSDLRNRAKLEEVLKPASIQGSLFKKGKILLMDEIDGVTGSDIGGVPELIRTIQISSHPIILTGNDIWQSKFSPLRPKCKLVELKHLPMESIMSLLNNISAQEKLSNSDTFLRQIALKSQGDLRAALNDLQAYSSGNYGESTILDEEKRHKEETIFNILKILFQERQDSLNIFDNTNMSLDEILLWIEENIPKEYRGQALFHAYEALAKADKFRGRIYRQQFWRFLLYQNIFQTAGISYSKKSPMRRFTKYERPKRILKIWLNNQKTAKKKTIAQKYAKHVHCSAKRSMKDFSTIKLILKKNPQIQSQLKLTDDEIAYLEK
jgi:replication factor C large subunit